MGLLSRLGRGARAALHDTGLPGVPLMNAALGGAVGGVLGEGGSWANPNDGGHGLEGALAGAALGGGLGLAGGLRQFARNMPFEMSHGAGSVLQEMKREALRYVRDPRAVQRIAQSESPQEIRQIVEESVAMSRSRMTEGGF